ncbi:hypothetical protein HZA44_02525 [Candidatus Peregrinibacteria bacterium]|nr:hypothetical protein [Candidatus Peregrinibacteria bacterium]
MPELDQAKANVEAAKAQAKLINAEKKAEALAKKEMLMSELARKGASGEAMNAFEASYDPRLRDTVSKIIENAKPAFNLHDPKSWEMIDAVLTDKKSGEFYSKVYEKEYFPLAPLIMPKKPKEPMRMEEVAIVGNVEKPERVSTAELNKAIDARLGAQLRKMREKLALKESVAKSVPKKQKPLMRMDEVAITGKVDKPATVARKGVDVSKSPVRRAEFPAEMMISRRPAKGVEEGIAAAMRIGAEKPNTGPSEEQLRKAGIDAISVWGTKLKSEGYPKSVISQAMKNEEILNDPEKSLYSALYDAFEGKQNIEKGVALYRKFMKEKATDEVAFEATKLALQGKPEKEAMALASRKVNGTPGKGFNTPSEEVAKK